MHLDVGTPWKWMRLRREKREIRRVWGGEQELAPCALELGSYSKV